MQSSQEKLKTMLTQHFFFGGGGVGVYKESVLREIRSWSGE